MAVASGFSELKSQDFGSVKTGVGRWLNSCEFSYGLEFGYGLEFSYGLEFRYGSLVQFSNIWLSKM
ncbi:MAG: hypothetical protein ACKOUR_12240 [Planctomycetota bacterium]